MYCKACKPGYIAYSLNVVYQDQAASQSMQIYEKRDDGSMMFYMSTNGYGRNHIQDKKDICLGPHRYIIFAHDRYVVETKNEGKRKNEARTSCWEEDRSLPRH